MGRPRVFSAPPWTSKSQGLARVRVLLVQAISARHLGSTDDAPAPTLTQQATQSIPAAIHGSVSGNISRSSSVLNQINAPLETRTTWRSSFKMSSCALTRCPAARHTAWRCRRVPAAREPSRPGVPTRPCSWRPAATSYKPTGARSEAGDAALAVALGTEAPTYRVPAVNASTSQRGGRRTVSGDPLTLEVYNKLSSAWVLHGFCFPRSRHKV